MSAIIIMKVFTGIGFGLLFLFFIYKTIKSVGGIKGILYAFLEIILAVGLIYGSMLMINKSFIKVRLTKFNNTPMPSSEKLAIRGCVKNDGTYKANVVTLHIKVINHASGGSLKQDRTDGRDNTLEIDVIVAKNLAPKTQKCFTKRFRYPPYFRLANIRSHISAY